MPVGIIIADHHDLLRHLLKTLIQAEKKARVFDASNGHATLEILNQTSIDLVVMDSRMSGLDGFETIRVIKSDFPKVKIIVMCSHEEKAMVINIVKHGVDGIILTKKSSSAEFLTAIDKVLSGEKYFNETTLQLMREADWMNLPQVEFSKRDLQILGLLDEGLISKQIAHSLNLTTNTVEFYRKRLLRKTQTKNSNELIRYIKNIGLLP